MGSAQGNLPTKHHLHIQSHHSAGRLRMHRHIGECKAHRKILGSTGSENIDIIKKADSTSTFGWQSGKRFVPGHDKDIVLDIDPSQRGMAAAYCQNGTMADRLKMIKPHRSRDKFRFILAASFTAPLLRIIKQRIFFVYNWGGSKRRKDRST